MAADDARDRLAEALGLLLEEARERLGERPGNGHRPPRGELELSLRLPLPASAATLTECREQLAEELDREIGALAASGRILPTGRVLCLRCRAADCEHSLPSSPREVLAGYGPTGLPRYVDFPQLLLERRDPRAEHLFGRKPGVIALVLSAEELLRDVLPAYAPEPSGPRLLGQVSAGWYRVRDAAGHAEEVVATFQVLAAGSERRPRLALHPVGAAADDAVQERLQGRRGRLPWGQAERWATTTLERIAGTARRRKLVAAERDARVAGLLRHLGERLERPSRARQRQTAHGHARHRSGQRPTSRALADLYAAPVERIFVDPRHGTFVTLGPKGRTHLFSDDGKLVTSVRYAKESIEKKQRMGEWRPATGEEAARLVGRARALEDAARGAESGL